MRETASETNGNSARSPVWNSSGSSARTTNWLNMMLASGTKVDRRKMPSAISSVRVSMSVSFLLSCRCCRCYFGQEHVDGAVDETGPPRAAGVVGDLLVGEAADERGPEIHGVGVVDPELGEQRLCTRGRARAKGRTTRVTARSRGSCAGRAAGSAPGRWWRRRRSGAPPGAMRRACPRPTRPATSPRTSATASCIPWANIAS